MRPPVNWMKHANRGVLGRDLWRLAGAVVVVALLALPAWSGTPRASVGANLPTLKSERAQMTPDPPLLPTVAGRPVLPNASVGGTIVLTNGSDESGNYLAPSVGTPIQTAYATGTDDILESGGHWLAVANASTWTVTGWVNLSSIQWPTWTVYDPLTDLAYVASWDDWYSIGSLTRVDVSNDSISTQTFGYSDVVSMAVGDDGHFIYFAETCVNCGGYNLAAFNVSSLRRIGGTSIAGSSSNLPGPMTYAARSSKLFVTNAGDNLVQILNVSNSSALPLVAQLKVTDPIDAAYDSRNNIVYIASGSNASLIGVNASSDKVVRSNPGVNNTRGIVYDPSDNRLIVSLANGSIAIVNGTTGKLMSTHPVSSSLGVGGVYDSALNVLALPGPTGQVLEVDTSNWSVKRSFWVGNLFPNDATIDPLNGDLYVDDSSGYIGSGGTTELEILNASGGPDITWIPIAPFASFYDPPARSIVAQLWDGISVVNASTNRLSSTLLTQNYPDSGPDSGTYDANSGDVYILSTAPVGGLMVYNATNFSFIRELPYGGTALISVPALQRLFIAVGASQVRVLNSTTDASVGVVSIGANCDPNDLAYDPSSGLVYVANSNCSYVSEFNATTLQSQPDIALPSAQDAESITYDPTAGGLLVTAPYQSAVFLISDQNDSVVSVMSVGSFPVAATFDPSSGLAYVVDNGQDTVTIVRTCNEVSCLRITSFSTEPSVLTLGSSLTISVSAEYQVGTVTYAYSGLPSGCISSNASILQCTPDAPGEANVTVSATDSTGTSALARTTVTVLPPRPAILSFGISPSSLWVGNETTLRVSATDEYGWLTYSFVGLPGGCTSLNSSEFGCMPSETGEFVVTVIVTDSYGSRSFANSSLNVGVLPSPSITNFSASKPVLFVGQTTMFSVGAVGAYGWLAYSYKDLPPGCASENTSSLSCAPGAPGNYTVRVIVTNALLRNSSADLEITVRTGETPTISQFSATPDVIYLGQVTRLQVVSSPGLESYVYSGLPVGCPNVNASELRCDPDGAGTFTIAVTVTDNDGFSASRQIALTVLTPPELTIQKFAANQSQLVEGTSLTLNVTAAGWIGWVNFVYQSLPPGCESENTSSLVCTPNLPGTYNVTVTISDQLNRSVGGQARVVVSPTPLNSTSGAGASPYLLWLVTGVVLTSIIALTIALLLKRRSGRTLIK
jgi:DNA-binding beta-propeller fold protein YncE